MIESLAPAIQYGRAVKISYRNMRIDGGGSNIVIMKSEGLLGAP